MFLLHMPLCVRHSMYPNADYKYITYVAYIQLDLVKYTLYLLYAWARVCFEAHTDSQTLRQRYVSSHWPRSLTAKNT